MHKGELIDAIAAHTNGLSKAQIHTVITAALETIQAELVQGGRVSLIDFGSFATVQRTARTGRHPGTGEPLKIPAATVVKFTAGKALKAQVNTPKRRKTKKTKK